MMFFGIITLMMFMVGFVMILAGTQEDSFPVVIGGAISFFTSIVFGLCMTFGIATVLLWLFALSIIHVLIFAVCYKVQRLEGETNKKEMIILAAIPICNVVVTIASLWAFMDYKHEMGKRVRYYFISKKNKIKLTFKNMLDGVLDIIDRCPPRSNKK